MSAAPDKTDKGKKQADNKKTSGKKSAASVVATAPSADTGQNAEAKSAPPPKFRWTFQSMGGLDQVVLHDGEALRRLGELDPKLWVALSCPASGLEFDSRTLALIDADRDGRIRIPEIRDAVAWTCARLKDPGGIAAGDDELRLDDIDDSTTFGKRLLATARAILRNLGKRNADFLTQEDVCRASSHASEQMFNGDGVLPPYPDLDQDVRDYINDAMDAIGAVEDAGGDNGINIPISRAFMKTLRDWSNWRQSVGQASTPLGDHTAEAWQLFGELRDKINDYFLRCDLASYAPSSQDALNPDSAVVVPSGQALLGADVLAALPLSRAAPEQPLNLATGVNPAWREVVTRFGELVEPVLTTPGEMTRDDWQKLRESFDPYAGVVSKKPEPAKADVTVPPTSTVDRLGDDRIREILESDLEARFEELAARDADVPASASDIAEVERLVLYHRHLHRLLSNFVSFEEFYSLRRNAAFQSGVLFIDGRSCRLCMPAEKIEEHSMLAANSQLYLLYCECTRGRKPADAAHADKLNMVAAVTAGDPDLLVPGRNGVYVDNEGEDWDATVVKIISNPIGLWQAVWSPYKRLGNMITDYLSRYASAKQNDLMATAGEKLEQLVAAPPTARFDIGRNVGIFAAVGLALGAIGTAVGSIVNALFGMAWWQFPLLLAGLFTIVSGPSLLMAWLKLRQRTLGPLLEASGWAINGRVAVNFALSRRLTTIAKLPANAQHSLKDPLARLRRYRKIIFYSSALLGMGAVMGLLYWRAQSRGWRNPRPSSPVIAAPAAQQGIAPTTTQPQPGPQPAAGSSPFVFLQQMQSPGGAQGQGSTPYFYFQAPPGSFVFPGQGSTPAIAPTETPAPPVTPSAGSTPTVVPPPTPAPKTPGAGTSSENTPAESGGSVSK